MLKQTEVFESNMTIFCRHIFEHFVNTFSFSTQLGFGIDFFLAPTIGKAKEDEIKKVIKGQ